MPFSYNGVYFRPRKTPLYENNFLRAETSQWRLLFKVGFNYFAVSAFIRFHMKHEQNMEFSPTVPPCQNCKSEKNHEG